MIKIIEIFGEPILRGGQESYVMSTIQNMDRSGFILTYSLHIIVIISNINHI